MVHPLIIKEQQKFYKENIEDFLIRYSGGYVVYHSGPHMDYRYYETKEELERANPHLFEGGNRIGIRPLVIDITEELFKRKGTIEDAERRGMTKRVKVRRFTRFEDASKSLITLRRVIDSGLNN